MTVYRDGHYIGTREIKDISTDDLVRMMVGRIVQFPKQEVSIGETVFQVEDFTGKGFKNISFSVRSGEILGLYGLVGSGRTETMRAIFGMDPHETGKLYYRGKELKIKNPHQAIMNGIAMVSEDRKGTGLVLNRPIRENISLPSLYKKQKGLFIRRKKELDEVSDISKKLTVKAASLETDAYSLSGGNQQKVVLSKWIMAVPNVLIMDEPTRGIDVGAKVQIYKLMCDFAAQGMAIIMVSSELPEVISMSDRLLVYYEGQIQAEFHRSEILAKTVTDEIILAKAFGQ